jgi:Homeodomain-like domain
MAVNKELAATALLEAVYTTDRQACERYGISERTLRRWR